jgi:hypothetical protein
VWYAGRVASITLFYHSPYQELCALVERLHGSVRLARATAGWALIVTVAGDERTPRAAGFHFGEIVELDAHARLILEWLRRDDP